MHINLSLNAYIYSGGTSLIGRWSSDQNEFLIFQKLLVSKKSDEISY